MNGEQIIVDEICSTDENFTSMCEDAKILFTKIKKIFDRANSIVNEHIFMQ